MSIPNTILSVICVIVLFCSSLLGQSKLDSLHKISSTTKGIERINVYISLADEYFKSDLDSSVFFGMKALELAKTEKSYNEIVRSYSIIGESYQKKNELKISVEYYLKAIEIAEKHEVKTALGNAYNGLGITYYFLDDLKMAEFYIQKALDAKLAVKDYTYYSVISTNLASMYFYQERYQDAIILLKSAEKVLIRENQGKYLSSLYNALGASYQQSEPELDSAEIYYWKSIEYAVEYKISDNVVTGHHNLGEMYYKRKDYNKAIYHLKKAEAESEKLNIDKYRISTYATLSEVYEAMNDFPKALRYKKKQFELNQSIFSTEKQKTIDELQIKYETAKKEQEIQAQQEEIQLANLKAEKEKNRFYVFLFIGLMLFIISGFTVVFILQRRKSAQELEREKLRIFENIVHDIRTPVTLIKGPLQLLKNDFSEHQKHITNIQLIERNAEKLVVLVNELLDASKLDAGKYRVTFQTGNIDLFFEEIIHSFTAESIDKKIKVEYTANNSMSNYSYCAATLEKIATNIISNSLKYCPENSVVTVKTTIADNKLMLTIADNGNGIPKNEQKRIFDRFYRRTEHKNITGTGIGLALVKELVKLAEGTLEMTSEIGQGTKFHIVIPIERVAAEEQVTEVDTSKLQLLLCEDDSDIVVFVRSILQDDFLITVAKDGNEGLTKFNEVLPDIVLSDVMMPHKDGLDLLQEIKSNSITNHIPVVLFSAKSSLESRLEGLKFGADNYISKPFNPDELRLILHNLTLTIQRNKQDFLENLHSKRSFDERIRSTNEYVNKIIGFVVLNIENVNYSVNELAEDMCISRSQLHRKLNTYTGFSTTNFIKMIRLEKAKDLLESNEGNVTEIAYSCGFNSQSYFSASFAEYFGESPSKFLSRQ